ncbi:TM2 domain-containing protein [Giardia muris]|uniref:TM2 domain-containing protein n=1 Tax=Giardia muris TaxID=5742 RepID=A0A4Z1T745_GIAMU|nr:TM2 domain-containing protein [Giardia muris]|eukprot:TNJ29893.1 TM2 domain-containing protein [Giardia muris]
MKSHRKSLLATYLLWFFLGFFGIHRFYLHKWCTGIIWLFTWGLFGIGWIVDVCLIPGMVSSYNEAVDADRRYRDLYQVRAAPPGYGPYPPPPPPNPA